MRIALVHDSLTQLGGAERVLDVLHEMFPKAPVFTLVFSDKLKEKYKGWDIRASWLQRIYKLFPKFQYLFPLIPMAVGSLRFKNFDLVISSSSSFAKNIRVPKGCLHVNYCHTPTRFLWLDGDYLTQEIPSWLKIFMPLFRLLLVVLRKWDYRCAQKVDAFFANSQEVKKRIQQIYHRESVVINPPIDTEFWQQTKLTEDYFLVAGRLQPHKGNERIIRLFSRLSTSLHVVGTGRQETYLKSFASKNVSFLGKISDEQLRDEYSGALGLIYPQIEDFGLMPLEAAACGTPSLGLAKAGSLETIIPGKTGELFSEAESDDELIARLRNWKKSDFNPEVLQTHAGTFGKARFSQDFKTRLSMILKKAGHENCG